MTTMTPEDIDCVSLELRDRIFHGRKGKLPEIVLGRGRWTLSATMEFALENGKSSTVIVKSCQDGEMLASTRELRIYSWNDKRVELETSVKGDGKTPVQFRWCLGKRCLGTIRDIHIEAHRERLVEDGRD